ncbi:hypothetical protein Prede_1137 [Prevotella dentalis DSM 3688]|uniref:Uncharacterized protein n=1 Tax=Prevotella dentalis (strain ATCC 49559 / DSM 3688 / JCM 13448 / NCTC 12043 / ES 2772) TaxID=908937 RepID=L0JAA9_PREDD|nr:hypothetical protein Prede_1137 [Prevotella dentalis DSM 3688]
MVSAHLCMAPGRHSAHGRKPPRGVTDGAKQGDMGEGMVRLS